MRIYLVEEENIVKRIIRDFLTELGHEVVVINVPYNLPDSLSKNLHPVDLIIMDFPATDRETTVRMIRELHERRPEIPFVLRASSVVLSADEAVQCGVYAYLHKPVRLAELELLLTRLSERRSSRLS